MPFFKNENMFSYFLSPLLQTYMCRRVTHPEAAGLTMSLKIFCMMGENVLDEFSRASYISQNDSVLPFHFLFSSSFLKNCQAPPCLGLLLSFLEMSLHVGLSL